MLQGNAGIKIRGGEYNIKILSMTRVNIPNSQGA